MLFELLLVGGMAAAPAAGVPNQPVAQLDLQRYSGRWHEIAHLPMFFQRKCADNITATYSALPDGTIGVTNACRTAKGETQQSDGVARRVPGQPGALKVRFAPGWLSWLPMVWADYWVIDLDPDYRWAVVGGPSRKYLWILSRSPTLSAEQFQAIRATAAAKGYPVRDLVIAAPLDKLDRR